MHEQESIEAHMAEERRARRIHTRMQRGSEKIWQPKTPGWKTRENRKPDKQFVGRVFFTGRQKLAVSKPSLKASGNKSFHLAVIKNRMWNSPPVSSYVFFSRKIVRYAASRIQIRYLLSRVPSSTTSLITHLCP